MQSTLRFDVQAWVAQLLNSNSEQAIVFVDTRGFVIAWLGGAERLFGYTAQEAVGLEFGILFTDEDRRLMLHAQEIAAAAASGRSEDDRWHVRKDGSLFWGSGLLEVVRSPDGAVAAYCKVLRDRTDVRTQLDASQNRLTAVEQQQQRVKHFVVSLGHEMRNLLGPMQNATTLIASTPNPQIRERSLSILERKLAAMKTLLDDLSEASQVTVARPRLNRQPVVVQQALSEAADAIRATVDERHQSLQLTLPSVSFTIDADPIRLQQMLLNLLGNASKYTPEGGNIHVSATIEAAMAVIRITDDGMGIDAEALPHIFELFTRGESGPGDAHKSIPGLGVGLAIVKEFATLHGGGIEARSAGSGKGSTFALRLPLSAGAAGGD